jgi:hypothetical protein
MPARSAGTVVTQWGSLPSYTGTQGNPIVLNPQRIPATPSVYKMEVDLLVERDGTVRDVALRSSSGFPELDKAIATELKGTRSLLVLAPTDPAPYVIRYTLARLVAAEDNTSQIPLSSYNDYRPVNDQRMGSGQYVAGDHPYRN